MQSSLETLVANVRQESLLAGATLVGKRVAVSGGFGQGGGGRPTETLVNLADGAEALTMSVYDTEGTLVFRQNVGAIEPGEHRFAWSGQDMDGNSSPIRNLSGDSQCSSRWSHETSRGFSARHGEQRLLESGHAELRSTSFRW